MEQGEVRPHLRKRDLDRIVAAELGKEVAEVAAVSAALFAAILRGVVDGAIVVLDDLGVLHAKPCRGSYIPIHLLKQGLTERTPVQKYRVFFQSQVALIEAINIKQGKKAANGEIWSRRKRRRIPGEEGLTGMPGVREEARSSRPRADVPGARQRAVRSKQQEQQPKVKEKRHAS